MNALYFPYLISCRHIKTIIKINKEYTYINNYNNNYIFVKKKKNENEMIIIKYHTMRFLNKI